MIDIARFILLTTFLLHAFSSCIAQEVRLDISDKPLNEVFIQLKYEYGVQFSFNDKVVSSCNVNVSQDFPSLETAISFLVEECGFEYQLIGDVYLIDKAERQRKQTFNFAGRISDKLNAEPLPFSSISLSTSGALTDANGGFSLSLQDSVVGICVSHIGYYRKDTVISAGRNISIQLTPQTIDLKEVVVSASSLIQEPSVSFETPATIKLNSRMAVYVPGSSDNTINNLLRLQSGILAAGEQAEDFTIWGSYKGQTHMIYDGITLFNISSLAQNIGVVNPLIINDVEVVKGGYNVERGDRVGGIVSITSTEGDRQKVKGAIRLSDQSTAARINLPLGKGLSLQAAGRFLFPQNFGTLIHSGLKGADGKRLFVDGNLKLSGSLANGDNFHLSFVGSGEQEYRGYSNKDYMFNSEHDNYQLGGNARYTKRWKKHGASTGSVSYSRFQSSISEFYSKEGQGSAQDSGTYYNGSRNSIAELQARIDHEFPARRIHRLGFGAGYVLNRSVLEFDSITIPLAKGRNDVSRVNAYVREAVFLGKYLTLQPGVRLDVTLEDPKVYFQPRLAILVKPNKHWRIRLAWGIYYQFITENAFVDPFSNQVYFWQVADGSRTFVQQSMQYVAGASFNKWGLNVAVDAYYKTLNSLIRWSYDEENNSPFFHANGTGRSYGFDVAIRQRIWKLTIAGTYSWSNSQDAFNSISNGSYIRAPHDQRHETKWTATLNLKPFFLSVNYIYGSGFPIQTVSGFHNSRYYGRLDAAFLIRKKIRQVELETGVSVLNVLNRNNIRYNRFTSFSDGVKNYQEATRITPLVFVALTF